MQKAITGAHTALSAHFYTLKRQLPCVIITELVSCCANTLSVNQKKAMVGLTLRDVAVWAELSLVCLSLIAGYMSSAAWQGLFNSTPTIIMVNSTRTQPFSIITHTNGTACNISSLRKPFTLPQPRSPTQNYHYTFPCCITESDTFPPLVSLSPGRSLPHCLSLCQRTTPTSYSSTWVLSGREIQTPA